MAWFVRRLLALVVAGVVCAAPGTAQGRHPSGVAVVGRRPAACPHAGVACPGAGCVGFNPSAPYAPGFGRGYDYGRRWVSPGYLYSRPWYTPPPTPYVPLSHEERFDGAYEKAVRAQRRGDLRRALAQYRDARRRATRFWGAASAPARRADAGLSAVEQSMLRARRAFRSGSPGRFLTQGDRALERGDYDRAEAGYHEALLRAAGRPEAGEVFGRLQTLRALRDAAPAAD